MTGFINDQELIRLQHEGAALRQRVAAMAAAIAWTEERLADTLDQIAVTRRNGTRKQNLQTLAAQAREFAKKERNRAARFVSPFPGTS